MATLEELLDQIKDLDQRRDHDGLRQVRQEILTSFPETDEAVEAQYKLGLDLLFRQRELDKALEFFTEAAKRKHPYWSAAARTSLGLCLYHQRRLQKALFELRRVAYPEQPTVHSVTALSFMENIFSSEGEHDEAAKIRKDRIEQLELLIDENRANKGDVQERGLHLYQLGIALLDSGETDDAYEILEEARIMGPQVLGADVYRSVIDVLGQKP